MLYTEIPNLKKHEYYSVTFVNRMWDDDEYASRTKLLTQLRRFKAVASKTVRGRYLDMHGNIFDIYIDTKLYPRRV